MNKKNGIYFYKDSEEETILELIEKLNRFIKKYDIVMKRIMYIDEDYINTKKKLIDFRVHIKQWTRSIRVKIEIIETLIISKNYEELDLDFYFNFTEINKKFKSLLKLFTQFKSPGNININYRRNPEEYIRRLVFLKKELLAFDSSEFDTLLAKMLEWVESYNPEVPGEQEIITDMKKTLIMIKRNALNCTKSREKMLKYFILILKFINQFK